MAMKPEISVKNLLMQAFLTGWERSDKSISQDEYLQSAIQVIEVLQVEPENVYAEEGLGLTDGDEVDHLDDLLRADGQWLYYGVEEENFFLIQWYPDKASAEAKLAELEALRSVLVRERRATAVLPLHGIEHKIRLSFELEQETGSSDGAGSPPRAKAADIL